VPLKRGKKRRVALQSGISRPTMERLWSLAVATSGNRWQMDGPRKRGNQAKTVAVGCDQLPKGAHGKEGVDGSSPSEGSAKAPQIGAFCLTGTCTFSSVRWVWSPSWSPQVHDARSKLAK
jgi:hypothetical protein